MMFIVLIDYGNSGIFIGNINMIKGYNIILVFVYIDLLKKVKMIFEGIINKLKFDLLNVEDVVKLYGLDNLIYDEKEKLKVVKKKMDVGWIFIILLVNCVNIGFMIGGYIGEDVFLYFYGF